MLKLTSRNPAARLAAASCAFALCAIALAQTPGEWRYTISTDPVGIPPDMRINFPTITFAACRTTEDFASGRAFALQTLASSSQRCPSGGFVRAPSASAAAASSRKPAQRDTLTYVYACDAGETLSGIASGSIETTRFTVNLESRYAPPVGGVSVVKQTMTAVRAGPCKVKPDADIVKIP